MQGNDGHDEYQDERPGNEEDVEAAVGAGREPDKHEDDQGEAEQVAEGGHADERDSAAALVLVRQPGIVPLVDEVEERDELDDQENARAEARNLACREGRE